MMEPILQVQAIDKTFPETGVHANQDISFSVQENEIIGIVGDNGAGKSTLVTILAGETAADAGSCMLDGVELANGCPHPRVGLVHQHPRVLPDRPLWESMLVGLPTPAFFHRRRMRNRIAARIAELDIQLPLDACGSQLSTGQLHLAELAAVLLRSPRLLILDEPTAACTPAERQIILETIQRQRGMAILYISHRTSEIRTLCTRVFRLDRGVLAPIAIDELTEPAPAYRSQIGCLNNQLAPICSVQGLSAEHPRLGHITDISFQVQPGEILGISGYRDHGLLLLEDILAGIRRPTAGSFQLRGSSIGSIAQARAAGMRYIPSQRFGRGLAYELSVLDSLCEHILLRHPETAAGGVWLMHRVRQRANAILQRLHLPLEPDRPLRSFSGGMRQRVLIGRETDIDDAVMAYALVCEPALGLDIDGQQLLWDALRELAARGAGVVLLSSSAEEIRPLCNRLLLLENGQLHDPSKESSS
ncbi:ATP-binding cassette domain-containing protein [Spirochaeta africana]|uniref:ATPase component of uncharacterized ABC-type transporter n=1 Tax=Spirochaeta africana (strain ATCC 700263 / DSM 8902 / Z-7692) TaxID=889378 RepID=H9UKL4_SPIAZ|nr:ATP-binding cassette domain-containing protein [Spirochaeta africana]AFG38057.1 ATPase component of uncharacterized ABC-type transporter [Spirochaeta africana DSM 8902]